MKIKRVGGPISWVVLLCFFLQPVGLGQRLQSSVELKDQKSGCAAKLLATTKAILNTRVIDSEWPRQIWWGILGSLFYPVTAAVKSIHYVGTWAVSKSPTPLPSKSSILKNILQAGVFAAIALAADLTTVSQYSLQANLPKHLNKNAVMVTLNGFPKTDSLFEQTERKFEQRYRNFPRAHYFAPSDDIDALEKLRKTAQEVGPIQILEIYGHGQPGAIDIGNGEFNEHRYSSPSGEKKRILVHRDSTTPLPPPNDLIQYQKSEAGSPLTFVIVNDELRPKDLLAPNAIITFYGCQTGRGQDGIIFMQYMAHVLTDQPVKIIASDVDVLPNFTDSFFRFYRLPPAEVPSSVNRLADLAFASVRLSGHLIHRMTQVERESWPTYVSLDHVQTLELPKP